MTYVGYFFDGPHQGLSLAAPLVLFALLALLGFPVGGRHRVIEAGPVFGWALAVTFLSAGNILFGLSFKVLAIVAALAAAASAAVCLRSRTWPLAPGTGKVLAILSPVLLMAAAMVPSQWDEFSHWVPTVRFLMEFHGFPTREVTETGGFFPGYPYNWSLLSYLTGLIGGRYLDNVGGLLNLLLLATWGMLAARLAMMGAGRDESARRSWLWAGFAVGLATVLNPIFVQKVAMTAYADTSTGVAVGFSLVLGWFMLEALADGDRDRARALAWQFGITAMVLVNVKQSNLILFLLLLMGIGLVAWRDSRIRPADLVPLLPMLALLPAAAYGLWRYHLISQDLLGTEAGFLPVEDWPIDKAHLVLLRMLSVASNKSGHFGIGTVAAVVGILALRRCDTPLRRLALMTGTLFLGFNGFMFVMYIVQFGEFDALRAASLWRYNMHIGLGVAAFAAYGAGTVWRRLADGRIDPRRVAWIPLALVLVAPFALPDKLRFDLEPPKPHFHQVGRAFAEILPDGAAYLILDVNGSGESNHITRYYFWRRDVVPRGVISAFQGGTPELIATASRNVDHVLVHSANAAVREYLGLALEDAVSYYVRRTARGTAQGGWEVVAQWAYPGPR